LHFELLDKNTPASAIPKLFEPIMAGKNVGILSESGCAGVADPGASAVAYAHEHGIRVVPMVGPSSILLALMASGLNGQRFAFHGYLPIEAKDAAGTIRLLELESREKNQTQIFIETPYRNNALMAHLLKSLKPDTRLCVALDLTSPKEKITCLPIREWKKQETSFEKVPAIFLFLAAS
jgi:16S rRNA (cytidine1402-2'-O)-methyltransferase